MKYCLGLFLGLLCISVAAQNRNRPKLGITLSGGGAKGLAHIGILKAIDSAGLNIDYVTGTSMGAIMGALYACGYSADSIEQIARNVNWDILLSNAASLRSMSMDEKNEYDKYAIELPWVNHGFRFPSGLLESEELWLKFGELFFPQYRVKDFTRLPRPFKCIATDVATGEAVILDQGELSMAVRSSMSIPSFFTAVNYNGQKLVDGGITRNFPVRDAKKMGADYSIGSSVSGGLLSKEKINNVFQVLLQVAFFREDEDTKKEKRLCDLYIHQDLDKYSMGSFGSAREIIDEGVEAGRKMYPVFKKLADSLDTIYGKETRKNDLLPQVDSVKITQYLVSGLEKTEASFFLHRLQFENNRWYTAAQLSDHIRKAFGTRYYQKIIYSLQPLADSTTRIIFNVEESPFAFSKLGVHYNSFTGFSVISNFTIRNFFTPYSRSMVTLNLGDNLRIRGEHLQSFGRFKNFSSSLSLQMERLTFNSYDAFDKTGVFKRGYLVADFNFRVGIKRKMSAGLGSRFEGFNYRPDISPKLSIEGDNNFFNSYLFFKYNSISNNIYPKKGLMVDFELGHIYNQRSTLRFFNGSEPITNIDSLGISLGNFSRATLYAINYLPVTDKITFIQQVQSGINFKGGQGLLNDYYVGGLNSNFRNQVLFAGLDEGTFHSRSVAALQLGLRCQLFNSLFVTGRANALYHDFLTDLGPQLNTGFLTGYALSVGYNFILGPLEFSVMYSDQAKRVLPYVNLGMSF